MVRCLVVLAVTGLAACGGGDAAVPPDASPDGAPIAAVAVACASVTPAVTISTAGGEYDPDTPTIAVGQVVRWVLSAGHTAHSNPTGLFGIGQGEQGCVRFQLAGDYDFYCQVHGFVGVIHVQ